MPGDAQTHATTTKNTHDLDLMDTKIGYLVGEFPVRSETFVLNQIAGLLTLGANIRILPLKIGQDSWQSDILSDNDIASRISNPLPSISRWTSIKDICLALIRKTQTPHTPSLYRIAKLLFAHSARPQIYDAIYRSNDYKDLDVVVCHHGPQGNRALWLRRSGFFKGPIITVFHGFDISGYLERYGEHVYTDLFREGDLFLPISDHWRHELIKLGCPANKIRTHHMGVNTSLFKYHHQSYIGTEPFHLLTVGRLTEKKGIEFAIKAIKVLADIGKNVALTVVGDGPDKHKLQKLTTDLTITDKVTFLGAQTNDEVRTLLSRSHGFILASVTALNGDKEGIPVSIMEAMAVGVPVISTVHSGIPELVKHGVNGLLGPERSVDAIVQSVISLMEDSSLRTRVARNARATIEHDFNVEVLSRRLQTYINEAIDRYVHQASDNL